MSYSSLRRQLVAVLGSSTVNQYEAAVVSRARAQLQRGEQAVMDRVRREYAQRMPGIVRWAHVQGERAGGLLAQEVEREIPSFLRIRPLEAPTPAPPPPPTTQDRAMAALVAPVMAAFGEGVEETAVPRIKNRLLPYVIGVPVLAFSLGWFVRSLRR